MHAIAWGATRVARPSRGQTRIACRIISGVRHPHSTRRVFHRSPIAYRIPDVPEVAAADEAKNPNQNVETKSEADVARENEPEMIETLPDSSEEPSRPRGRSENGFAATRRAARNKRPKEVPPLLFPNWFWDRNVKCYGEEESASWRTASKRGLVVERDGASEEKTLTEADRIQNLSKNTRDSGNVPEEAKQTPVAQHLEHLNVKPSASEQNHIQSLENRVLDENHHESGLEEEEGNPAQVKDASSQPQAKEIPVAQYHLDLSIYAEILTSVQAGLILEPPQNVDVKDLVRPDLLLQCPRDEGTSFLNEIVAKVASDVGADIVRLDSEDIAQIVGTYMGENIAWTRCDTSLLGYEAHRVSGKLESYDKYEQPDEEAEENFDDPDGQDSMSSATKISPNRLPSFLSSLKKLPMVFVQSATVGSGNKLPPMIQNMLRGQGDSNIHGFPSSAVPTENWQDFKLTAALEALMDSAEAKRARLTAAMEETTATSPVPESKGLIIQINEYKELNKIPLGANILAKFREVAKRRWHEGKNLIVVGTTTAEDPVPALTRSSISRLQSDVVFGDHRTIFIPPGQDHVESTNSSFLDDEETRTKQLNIRHVQDLVQKFLGNQKDIDKLDLNENYETAFLMDVKGSGRANILNGFDIDRELSGSVMEYARAHRIASTIVGMYGRPSTKDNLSGLLPELSHLDYMSLYYAMFLLHQSDKLKFDWAREERKRENGDFDMMEKEEEYEAIPNAKKTVKTRMEKLKKTCNAHELKLLGGVIDPADINTTFSDVRAPPQTIEALRTLTSLSLIRPESFSYGVLATDKIPGLLLYGPPGTGKTLLAKAVAKESGATVLEVSASEINDMYVGEGEKNVKAVFSLAKKLSPCVVFIDEADALFGARGDSSKRTSHRELINQFLREWDGMNDLSAFIMVATNRPFDLDEAVLRRLPRRLLIDLPLEKDREAILKIHLKNEILDESISLTSLAKDTPFYSGSDLKNLSVAAALACVRDENEAAKNHEGEDPYIFPLKRILTKRHFDKAMEEISASISEEMSTLTAIRKFDERYGDRKGRRKKGAGLGFGGTTVPERDSEAGRVRKIEVAA